MQAVESLAKAGKPEPHEFVGVVSEATPAYFIKCSCGYNGLSRDPDECPDCVSRANYHASQTTKNLERQSVSNGEVDLQKMVNHAVESATSGLQDIIAQLRDELAKAQTTKPTSKPTVIPNPQQGSQS